MTKPQIKVQQLELKNPISELVGYTFLGRSKPVKVHGLSRVGPRRLERLARENIPQISSEISEIFYRSSIKVISSVEGDYSSIPSSRRIYFYYFSQSQFP